MVRQQSASTPWGRITALLAACFATLLGVARGLDPDVILCRALFAAIVLGAVVAVATRMVAALAGPGAAPNGRR